eukprot:TRINITY_DN9044_c0_g1_i1.p1 TRINITY_DN9044_c0_g1~~TRINITY_DN9044_c0_g1_i1.p1  ORF type:complete len:383 (-),score=45.33 TRINITY_DN9044_c0_g1_i1:39-1187(-)
MEDKAKGCCPALWMLLSCVVLVLWIGAPASAGSAIQQQPRQPGSLEGTVLASKDLRVTYTSPTSIHVDFLYGGKETGIYCDWIYHPIVEVAVPTNLHVAELKVIAKTVQTSTIEAELAELLSELRYVKVSQTSKLNITADDDGFTTTHPSRGAFFPGWPNMNRRQTPDNHTFSTEGYLLLDNFTFPALAPTAEDIPVKAGGFKFGHSIVNWPFTEAALINGYLEQSVTVSFYPPELVIPPSASDPNHVYINHTDGLQTWILSLEDGAYTDGSYLPISLATNYNTDLGVLNMVFQYQPGLDIFYDPSIQALIDTPDDNPNGNSGDGSHDDAVKIAVAVVVPVAVLCVATGLVLVIGILVVTAYIRHKRVASLRERAHTITDEI